METREGQPQAETVVEPSPVPQSPSLDLLLQPENKPQRDRRQQTTGAPSPRHARGVRADDGITLDRV
jgi:hypothetical protein